MARDKELLCKYYYGEEIYDAYRDVSEALEEAETYDIENGQDYTFCITITRTTE